MQKLKKNSLLFSIGGIGYAVIELLWRGRTHWSMMLAGGICFVLFSKIAARFRCRPLLYKAILCALAVTSVELIFGIIFNLILRKNVWDYSKIPFNFLGQICLLYTVLWGFLSCAFLPLADFINKKFKEV